MRLTQGSLGIILSCLSLGASFAQQPVTLRYKFKTGDELIYRETFEQERKSPQQSYRTRIVFSNHVLVLDASSGSALIGVQRNRQSAELLEYRENGHDRLAQEKPDFERRSALRPSRSFDANLYNDAGIPQLPIDVLREANSDLLNSVSEIVTLPETPVEPGSEWMSNILGTKMRFTGTKNLRGESCVDADIAGGGRSGTRVAYTFCPESGRLAGLSFEGQYQQIGDAIVTERVIFELVDARSGQTPAAWLENADTQLGTLDTYLLASHASPDAASLDQLLRNSDPSVQALALAVIYQRNLPVTQDTLATLTHSTDPQVRRIAARPTQKTIAKTGQPCAIPSRTFPLQKSGTTLRAINSGPFAGTPYIVRVPIDYRPDQAFPLVLYLSGGGGRALDALHTSNDALRGTGYLAVFPQANGMWWEPKQVQMVHALLEEILRDYNVDTNRLYISGFSNGGTGALYYATLWPERFAAVSALMGAAVRIETPYQMVLPNLLNVPVLFVHGDKDPRIPASASVATYDQLRSLHPRIDPELHILKNREHDITLNSDDGYTLPFFERFVREPWPKTVTAEFSIAGAQRQYWIELPQNPSGHARVTGQLAPDKVIELKSRNASQIRVLLRPESVPGETAVRVRLNGKELAPFKIARNCDLFIKSAQQWLDPDLAYTDEILLDASK
jgi:pimeloyl-ACP methyl ester carboxylesterase